MMFEGSEDMRNLNEMWFSGLFQGFIDIIRDQCNTPFINDHYPERMEKYNKTKDMKHVFKGFPEKQDKQFECLVHGDAWCNNFLFKGEEISLIDWQIIRRAR